MFLSISDRVYCLENGAVIAHGTPKEVRNNPLVFTDPDGRDLILGSGDQKRIKKAVVEMAKRPGGRELLQKLDKLTIQIMVSTGETTRGDYG